MIRGLKSNSSIALLLCSTVLSGDAKDIPQFPKPNNTFKQSVQVGLIRPEAKAGGGRHRLGTDQMRELTCEGTSQGGQPMHFQPTTESIVLSTEG